MSVDTREPRDASRYETLLHDDLRIYYSPRLGRISQTLELDLARLLFRSKPILSGPEQLLAAVLMGRL